MQKLEKRIVNFLEENVAFYPFEETFADGKFSVKIASYKDEKGRIRAKSLERYVGEEDVIATFLFEHIIPEPLENLTINMQDGFYKKEIIDNLRGKNTSNTITARYDSKGNLKEIVVDLVHKSSENEKKIVSAEMSDEGFKISDDEKEFSTVLFTQENKTVCVTVSGKGEYVAYKFEAKDVSLREKTEEILDRLYKNI